MFNRCVKIFIAAFIALPKYLHSWRIPPTARLCSRHNKLIINRGVGREISELMCAFIFVHPNNPTDLGCLRSKIIFPMRNDFFLFTSLPL